MVTIRRQRRATRQPAGLAEAPAGADGSRYAALALAVRLNSFPGLANQIRQSPVPPGMIVVIRVASGCSQTRADAVAATGLDERLLIGAAILLVSLFLGDRRGDPRRILCVQPHAPVDEVRDHMKWLLKWLHPDRNSQAAVSSMAGRVIDAWGQFKSAGLTTAQPLPVVLSSADGGRPRAKTSRSKWRAIPLNVRRAQLEAAAGVEKVRRDVTAELHDIRNLERPSLDDA